MKFAVYHLSKTTFGRPRHMNGVSLLLQSPSQHCNGHLHYSFSDYDSFSHSIRFHMFFGRYPSNIKNICEKISTKTYEKIPNAHFLSLFMAFGPDQEIPLISGQLFRKYFDPRGNPIENLVLKNT